LDKIKSEKNGKTGLMASDIREKDEVTLEGWA